MKLRIVKPKVEYITSIENPEWASQALKIIEQCGRASHKSENRITKDSAEPFIRKVAIQWKHESILEHINFTVCFIGSRTLSHQLVRHRIGAYTQESQRYCDYSKEKTGKVLNIIIPPSIGDLPEGTTVKLCNLFIIDIIKCFLPDNSVEVVEKHKPLGRYLRSCLEDYRTYNELCKDGVPAEDAREALPNGTKTEVYTTFNLRQWRHFFSMRMDQHAQWQIKQLATEVYEYFKQHLPIITENLFSHSGKDLNEV